MNILVTCDENYLNPLKTMFYSLFQSNEGDFDIYLIHSKIRDEEIKLLKKYVEETSNKRASLNPIMMTEHFDQARTTFYYTQEMYYRLLSYKVLPEDLTRILYLDPDLLIINSLDELYKVDFEGKSFVAAKHTGPAVQTFNAARLSISSEEGGVREYYNSGILLINLAKMREEDREDDILDFIENSTDLASLMPDQDLLNVVFLNDIKEVSEFKYNYDARKTSSYKIIFNFSDSKEVLEKTSILHFCGKAKPWKDPYIGTFKSLYKYMMRRSYLIDRALREET